MAKQESSSKGTEREWSLRTRERTVKAGKWFQVERMFHSIKGSQDTQQDKHWCSSTGFWKKMVFDGLSKSGEGWRLMQADWGHGVRGWDLREWRGGTTSARTFIPKGRMSEGRLTEDTRAQRVFLLLLFCFLSVQRFKHLFRPRERSQDRRDGWR